MRLTEYITQAADRVFEKKVVKPSKSRKSPGWYDKECRQLRGEAVKAGERTISDGDIRDLLQKSQAYKACKQRKTRQYRRNAILEIEETYNKNRCDIWKALSRYTRSGVSYDTPNAEDFFELFKDLAQGRSVEYFSYDYEKCALDFLKRYDKRDVSWQENRCLKLQIINDNFTESEISDTIESLKNNKSPGIDLIPAEFIKVCKPELVPLITDALNYIISNRDYPDLWAEGLRSPVFKSGLIKDTNNYRGITMLSVFTKIFETAVNNRMSFVSAAYNTGDKYNGGFTKGSRTSDKLFILQGLVETNDPRKAVIPLYGRLFQGF